MAVQNLVSASLAAETKQEILKAIAEAKGKLDFLLTLRSSQVVGLVKAGKEFGPFLDECHKVVQTHPEILSGAFDRAEFERDYQLSQDLGDIVESVDQFSEALNHTLTAVRSDTLMAGFDVYAATKLNQDRVPGLRAVVETLAAFFKRTPRAKPASK